MANDIESPTAVSSLGRREWKEGNKTPYKTEVLLEEIRCSDPGQDRRTGIIVTLRELRVRVFVIDSTAFSTTADVLYDVRRVVKLVARENRISFGQGPLDVQRCLLYQDRNGRLFNLILAKHAAGPAGTWQEYFDTFSGMEAMIALTVLCRSFPCAMEVDIISTFKPAYLSLILGLVLSEEISLSWLNTSMLVRAAPSVSGHTLISPFGFGSDLLRKGLLLCLALAGAAKGITQKVLTFLGITAACIVLLANLGARAWHFMKWKPLPYDGFGASLLSYLAAFGTGIALPYMGHRTIEAGGKAALECIIRTAFFVIFAFFISDLDQVQQFLVVGSENCNQKYVNVVIGAWWSSTLIFSLLLAQRLPSHRQQPEDGEHLLVYDHASPVGYKIPSLPDFEIDPTLAIKGAPCVPAMLELIFGIVMALAFGIVVIYLGFAEWDNELVQRVQEHVDKVF